ncbi:hypothetical protein K3495_g2057 [Podosphaera aphanis]|nr:hypothetical protein K3495_g2057 [Podosphaera aphanis]
MLQMLIALTSLNCDTRTESEAVKAILDLSRFTLLRRILLAGDLKLKQTRWQASTASNQLAAESLSESGSE